MISTPSNLSPTAPPLGIGQIFERGWITIKDQMPLVAGLSLVALLGMATAGSIPVLGWALNALIGSGYVACLLRIRRGEKFDFADFLWAFQNMNRLVHVVLAALMVFAVVIFGTILMIIPGIWIYVMLSLTTVIQVRDDKDAVAALKGSYELVQGDWWRVFGLVLFVAGLNLLGLMCFLIGVLVTLPISYLMILEMSEDLARRKSMALPPTAGSSTAPPASSFQVNPST